MRPASIGFEQCVCGDGDLSHDDDDSDLGRLAGVDKLRVLGLEVGIVSGSDEGWHID